MISVKREAEANLIEHGSDKKSESDRVRVTGDATRVSEIVIAHLITTASVVPLSATRHGGMK